AGVSHRPGYFRSGRSPPLRGRSIRLGQSAGALAAGNQTARNDHFFRPPRSRPQSDGEFSRAAGGLFYRSRRLAKRGANAPAGKTDLQTKPGNRSGAAREPSAGEHRSNKKYPRRATFHRGDRGKSAGAQSGGRRADRPDKSRRRGEPRMKRLQQTAEKSRPRSPRRKDFPRPSSGAAFHSVLAGGIVLRLLVSAYLGYFNNDNHLAVIEYVSRVWLPPHAAQFDQAYHPPLYYFLAAPLFLAGRLAAVQGLSLVLSILTLALIAALIRGLPGLDKKIQPWCLALPAFHPQFILFGLFISNDTLAIFLGALVFDQCRRAQTAPTLGNYVLL